MLILDGNQIEKPKACMRNSFFTYFTLPELLGVYHHMTIWWLRGSDSGIFRKLNIGLRKVMRQNKKQIPRKVH